MEILGGPQIMKGGSPASGYSCSPREEKSPCDAPLFMLFSTENTFTITPLPAPPSNETEDISQINFQVPKSLIIDKTTLKMIEHGIHLSLCLNLSL